LRRYIDLVSDTEGFNCRSKVWSPGPEREIGRLLVFISHQI
jgi:hypothetical protein